MATVLGLGCYGGGKGGGSFGVVVSSDNGRGDGGGSVGVVFVGWEL